LPGICGWFFRFAPLASFSVTVLGFGFRSRRSRAITAMTAIPVPPWQCGSPGTTVTSRSLSHLRLSRNPLIIMCNQQIQRQKHRRVHRVSMQSKEKASGTSMREIQAGLERLERQEWWRWATALFIMLLLSLGVFSLSLPGPRKDLFTRYQWDLAVPGLFVTILIFNVFVVHQQIRISRFRRQLSGQ